MITVLSGGTGGAKFVDGLSRVVPPRDLTVVVNTGDDLVWWGLNVSPDVDSIVYVLAGILSRERGWGIEGDTFHCLEAMRRLGEPAWFSLGDRDLGTHLLRTRLLASGNTLSEATAEISRRLNVQARILPMTDDKVETSVLTSGGELSFEEYFVREHHQVAVEGVRFTGADHAKAAPGVVEAINEADAVLIAPSNPVTSIGPILAIREIRQALVHTCAPVVAVSPILGNAAVSGPAGELMRSQALPVSALGAAQAYEEFLDVLLLDQSDERLIPELQRLEIGGVATNILMKSTEDRDRLARTAVECCISHSSPG
ncbi:MAG TPA: 2-phospho-L-lactate transferase [Terriglobales bacterium]|nr:2-phospho-L-lactate transferase [Terriglobales bacterium]